MPDGRPKTDTKVTKSSSDVAKPSDGGGQSSSAGGAPGEEMMLPPPKPTYANGMLTSSASPNMQAVQRLLGIRTRRYEGVLNRYSSAVTIGDAPMFMRYYIPAMLRDPEIWYGIEMLRGPIISKTKYKVISTNPEIVEYVERQIKRFISRGLPSSLSSLTFGHIGLETLYRWNAEHQFVEFHKFRYIHPNDSRPVLNDGELVGIVVNQVRSYVATDDRVLSRMSVGGDVGLWQNGGSNTFLRGPKAFWAVHDQKNHRWYGRSRLEGAFIPWYECWQPQGYRSIRHGWFYKSCYDSGAIEYPAGSTQDEETGEEIPNIQLAMEMLDRRETGAGIAYEASMMETGGWKYIPPTGYEMPEGLFDYGDKLRDEKWEGLGVPPEVAKAEQTGSFAGRRVPQQAFYSFLQEIANEQVFDFDEQVIRYLVALNFGMDASYDIEEVPILVTLQQEEMGGITGHLPGDENDDFYTGGQQSQSGGTVQSGGRIEDRDSNGFNKAEAAFTKGAKAKAKPKPKAKDKK